MTISTTECKRVHGSWECQYNSNLTAPNPHVTFQHNNVQLLYAYSRYTDLFDFHQSK